MNEQQFEQYQNIPDSKFVFAQQDSNIHDKKFDTKAVSFARDSFRRFCKNKSSVVAAVILGIIILFAIFVPMFSTHNIDAVSPKEVFLEPKLFDTGTGFWDGTRKYTRIVYDSVNETPANFYKGAVLDLKLDEEPTLIDQALSYGSGGYVMFENQDVSGVEPATLSSDSFTVTDSGHYKADVQFGDEANIYNENIGEYRILLNVNGEQATLRDWSTDYSAGQFDLSQTLRTLGLDSASVRLQFELKATEGAYSYILLKSCLFTADEDVENTEELQTVGFTDATKMVLLSKDAFGVTPKGYWSGISKNNFRKGIYASEIYYCDFVFDTYANVYDSAEVTFARSEIDEFIKNGWCKYDESVGPESFEKLSDECPIDYVTSQVINTRTGKLQELTAMSPRYRQMGYKTMPKFIFGTDANGIDVFTQMFNGLRTSLVLGVCTFLFCFLFGLVWGSTSGYFGGWVDLSMERFTDILGGVPWIVVMTLCILHLGNNFFTFFLALCMTGWMGTAGITRTQFYRFKKQEHVLAARTLGASDWRLIFKHILPNSMGTIITSSVLMIPSVIYSEATLAYLNLGLKGTSSFGVMLSENQQYIQSHSYLIVIPSIVMALLMISFNLFGNGLRDAVNPTLKGSEG